MFFFHIPKTGGQNLASRIAQSFQLGKSHILGETLCHPNGGETLKKLLEQYDFVEKHVQGPALKGCECESVLTAVREPVSQLASCYLHILRNNNSNLHRAAMILRADDFFLKFGDVLANFQTNYIIQAYHDWSPKIVSLKNRYGLAVDILQRLRWVIPSELTDEFCTLWALEMRRPVPVERGRINVAEKNEKYLDLVALIQSRPDLWHMDYALWQAARGLYDNYRNQLLKHLAPAPTFDGVCFSNLNSSIWLGRGWYAPESDSHYRKVWWSGPENYSEICYVRTEHERYLSFCVIVYCGVSKDDIFAVGRDREDRLPIQFRKTGDSEWEYTVDLVGTPLNGAIFLWVPVVYAPIMVSDSSTNTRRQAFAACNWSLVE